MLLEIYNACPVPLKDLLQNFVNSFGEDEIFNNVLFGPYTFIYAYLPRLGNATTKGMAQRGVNITTITCV